MHILMAQDEQLSPTLLEISILTALADRPIGAKDIGMLLSQDRLSSATMSTGAVYAALRRLRLFHLIVQIEDPDKAIWRGKPRIIYDLTDLGETILSWEIESLEHLTAAATRR